MRRYNAPRQFYDCLYRAAAIIGRRFDLYGKRLLISKQKNVRYLSACLNTARIESPVVLHECELALLVLLQQKQC